MKERNIICLLCIVIFIYGFTSVQAQVNTNNNNNTSVSYPQGDAYKNGALSYKLIHVSNNTWGYNIFVNDKLIIHQPLVPGVVGNEGFKKKHDAKKVALLVIDKMKKGEILPSISIEEMKKLKIH